MDETAYKDVPKYIYKYMSLKNLKLLLSNSALHFSLVSNFNDPFEFKADIQCPSKKKDMLRIIKNLKVTSNRKIKKADIDTRDFSDTIKENIKTALNKVRVCCFSMTSESILMWSHYADKHGGVCLVFDTSLSVFFNDACVVDYSNIQYPKYNLFKDSECDGIHKQVYSKAPDWFYEREVRIINTSNYENILFDKSLLVEIIFGCNCRPWDIEEIKTLSASKGFIDTVFFQMHISNKEYKLIKKPLILPK